MSKLLKIKKDKNTHKPSSNKDDLMRAAVLLLKNSENKKEAA